MDSSRSIGFVIGEVTRVDNVTCAGNVTSVDDDTSFGVEDGAGVVSSVGSVSRPIQILMAKVAKWITKGLPARHVKKPAVNVQADVIIVQHRWRPRA